MRRKEALAVYFSALMQGLALVAFPAASSVFTSSQEFNFSTAAYGGMFIPQSILAVLLSFLSARWINRGKIRRVFLFGLFASGLSMSLLALSPMFVGHSIFAYGILLLATGFLGVGFGLTVPALNSFASVFFPKKADSAILVLNAFLGLGTALSPVLISLFIGFAAWWGLPLLLSALLLSTFLFSITLPLEGAGFKATLGVKSRLPFSFWLFAAFAFLYGMLETMNGNWVAVYMTKNLGAKESVASLALTAFWSMVTIGRIFFALIQKVLSPKNTFRLLPFILAGSFILISTLSSRNPSLGIWSFALAGLGCSALLPLIISLGGKAFPPIPIPSVFIGLYLSGYGIAAFGVGIVEDLLSLNLQSIFGFCFILSLLLGWLSFKVTKDR